MSEAAGSSDSVAQHYNLVPEKGIEERTKSRIFYLRNLNNWIKSMLIGETLDRIRKEKGGGKLVALDLCCGKGGDLLKWKKGGISNLTCADIADVSLDQCKSRYDEMKQRQAMERRPSPLFDAEFFLADCSKQRLEDLFSKETQFDLCSCQFSLHYAFGSLAQARCMLQNACESLSPGGFFIGSLPDSNLLLAELRKSPDMRIQNDVCKITVEDESEMRGPAPPPLFHAQYHFQLDQVVNFPEYLVHFPLLEHLLKKLDMELVYKKSFGEMVAEYAETRDGKQLLARMQALEPFPPDDDVELMGDAAQYAAARLRIQSLGAQMEKKLGTLSEPEWEVAALYQVFVFQKKKH